MSIGDRGAGRQRRLAELSAEKREYLGRLLRGTPGAGRVPIERRARPAGGQAVSYGQQRLWFLDRLEPGGAVYTTVTLLRLEEPVAVGALEASLTAIVERHEVLRTTFIEVGGEPRQVIGPARAVPVAVVDLRGEPAGGRRGAATRVATEEARRGFDLGRGPVLRATLVRLGEEEAVLVLAVHHIATDGWSMGVLSRELRTLYEAAGAGREARLAVLPIQYVDYALWQREWVQGEVLAGQVAYWREQLAGVGSLALPTDRPRPAVGSSRGGRVWLTIPGAVVEGLRAVAREERGTLFMGLLAGFQVLLGRYTGQTDIAVGVPTANRTRAEVEGLIGFFVNTLVMRTDLSGGPSFREVLRRVRQVALGAYGHQEVPFEKLVEELQPARDLSRNPFFQVTFQLQTLSALIRSSVIASNDVEVAKTTSMFDLALDLWETGEGVSGQLEYSSDLFDRETIERLAGHYQAVLAGAVGRPETPITTLELLTRAERDMLLGSWNATQQPMPAECVHGLVEAQAGRTPGAVAVRDASASLTYAELTRRANQVGRRLQGLGVGPDTIVGVWLPRSPALVIGLLGVLKAGGAYLPLDLATPGERVAWLLADAQVGAVVTDGAHRGSLPEAAGRALCLLDDPGLLAEDPTPPPSRVSPSHLAYVIYTSGSTGTPKGVAIEHRSLVNLMTWHQTTYGIGPADRASQLASLSFDASVWEIWPYLASGASLHFVDESTRLSASALVEWLRANRITVGFLPTPLAEAVLDEPWPSDATLRLLLTGGDRLRAGLRKAQRFRVINHYGPTETTVVATAGEVGLAQESTIAPHIGRPIANVRAYVLDACRQPVPIGVPGELYLGGIGLARGYLNRRELTEERFVPDPLDATSGARVFRTADRVRYRADGNLEFLERLDAQIKVRGFRVEPGEIEARLGEHPAVRQSVVVAHEDAQGTRLIAYVVWRGTAACSAAELRAFLARTLPAHLVPPSFVALDAVPLTPGGKIDRRALTSRAFAQSPGAAFVAPRTPVEKQLADVWAGLLRVDRVGVEDDFFALGGHSLLATRMISRVRDAFGIDLPIRAVFDSPTVAAIARVIEASAGAPARSPAAIAPVARERYRTTMSSDGTVSIPPALRSDPP